VADPMVALRTSYLQYFTGKNRFFHKNIGIFAITFVFQPVSMVFLRHMKKRIFFNHIQKKLGPAKPGKIFFQKTRQNIFSKKFSQFFG